MIRSKVIVCLLCLAISAGAVRSQEKPPTNSDVLKKKIGTVSLIYKRTLLRHYDELISSLEKDREDFKEARALGGSAEALADLDREIERVNKELASAAELARSLRAEMQQLAPETTTVTSANPLNLPCNCFEMLAREGLQPETLEERDVKERLPGLIWCGTAGQNKISVQTFAEYAAPILWFSPNEPLPLDKVPQPLPGHEATGAVVYYRISDLLLRSGILKSEVDSSKEIQLDQIKALTIKYYFYYSIDSGFHEHTHDLESVRLDINFTARNEKGKEVEDPTRGTHYVANITSVSGAAHGVTWYANQLDFGEREGDTSLPITLLIEEGKHATSPDRNADGFYSPGYDVNKRYTDAWGVRDLIGSGELGSAKYEGSMTKPRRPEHMVKVRPSDDGMRRCLLQPYTGEHKNALAASSREYTLTPAQKFETEAELQTRLDEQRKSAREKQARLGKKDENNNNDENEDKITGWVKREKFGQPPKKKDGDPWLLRALRWGTGIERNEEFLDAIPIAYRAEGRQHGFTILPPIFRYKPFFGGYVLPKLNFMFSSTREGASAGSRIPDRPIRFSLEGLYTPSAARTFDWYATSGAEWARPGPGRGYEGRLVNEGGLRFRFNWNNLLLGGRVGLRVTGFAEARAPRFIFEFGTGAF
jgi:hypothetical protein